MARAKPIGIPPLQRAALVAKRAASLAALVLAGCGGSISLGFGFGDDFDGSFPSVSLAASADSASPGATVQLIAAASDPNGIDSVAFYQFDAGNSGSATLLGADGSTPFQWNAVIPIAGTTTSVSYFARATDAFGNQADSQVVTVAIVP